MPITLDELVANLAKRPLPALAVTVKRVQLLLDDPNTNNHSLQQVIGLDPGFTMDLYRRFGVISGSRRGPVSNIAHAISMLGPAPVQQAVNSLPVLDKNLPDAAKSGIYHCYSRAVHASIYAQDMGAQRGEKNPEEMGHAALLYNCAEMALWTYANKAMQKIHRVVTKGADYGSASHSVLGFTLEQLSTELARVWHLSPLIVEAMERAWQSQPRPMGVVLANSLARASALSWYSPEINELIEFLADFRRETGERTLVRLHSQAAIIARQLAGMPLPVPAYHILQHTPKEVNPTPETAQTKLKEAPIKRAAKKPQGASIQQPATKPTPQPTPRPATQPPARPMAAAAKPQKRVEEKPTPPPVTPPTPKSEPKPIPKIEKPARKAVRAMVSTEWKGHLTKLMRNLRDKLHLKRVMFVMLSPDQKQAGVGHLMGADSHSRLHNFTVDIKGKNLFAILLSRQQGFWLKPDNSVKFLPMIPEDVRESIDQRGFFCMSIFVRNKPVGFIYADGKDAMNDECYTQFKQLCANLGPELGKRT